MISVRRIIVGIALAFTGYLALRGLWWTEPPVQPLVIVAALSLYWSRSGSASSGSLVAHRSPRPSMVLRPASSAVRGPAFRAGPVSWRSPPPSSFPTAIAVAVRPEDRTDPFATWYLGGIGVLMVIVMVRRRPWVAWIGIAALAVGSIYWMGLVNAMSLGLVGSIVWVAATQLMLLSIDRAARDTAQLAQLQRAASAWQASQSGRQRERRIQVQRALAVAGPVLTRTVATGGALTDEERTRRIWPRVAWRDEMRGPGCSTTPCTAELERAAARGERDRARRGRLGRTRRGRARGDPG